MFMQNLSIFNYNQSSVRTFLDKNNELWFLINDVCAILDYKNPHRALNLHCKPKGITKRYTPTKGGKQEMVYINEPNLYRLIIKCQKPEAEPFETWVMEEVLPFIRKTGTYSIAKTQTISIEQAAQIREAIIYNQERTNNSFQKIYSDLMAFLDIENYEYMPVEHFTAAIKFLKKDYPADIFCGSIPKKVYVSEQNLVSLLNILTKFQERIFAHNATSNLPNPFEPYSDYFRNINLGLTLLMGELEHQLN
jgi:prophage antirepressor-like protein